MACSTCRSPRVSISPSGEVRNNPRNWTSEAINWSRTIERKQEVVDKLNEALLAALKDPAVARQLEQQGFEVQGSSPSELKAFIAKELARWERVIKDNNIKVAL